MTARLTNKEFLSKLYSINKDVIPLEEYTGGEKKIKVTYRSCGHIEYKKAKKLLIGQKCGHRDCYNKRISQARINGAEQRNVAKVESMGYVLLEPYKGIKTKTKVLNTNCNHQYKATLNNVMQGSGCPVCHGMKDTKRFIEIINEKYPDQYEVLGEYFNNRTPIEVKHLECGHQWDVIPKDLLNRERCPNCIKSHGERYVENYLKSNSVKYETQFIFDDCRNINPLPFDFAVFLNGNVGLIEFDGCQHFENSSGYWGSDSDDYETVHYRDAIKTNYCKDHEIPLLRIPYWWIRNDKAERELNTFLSEL